MNALLPDGTKSLPEPMLTYHQKGPVTFIWGWFCKKYLGHLLLRLASNLRCFFNKIDDAAFFMTSRLQIGDNSGWNCQPWPSRSQNWMFVHFIIIFSQFPTSSSQNQVELGEWVTGHFMHCDKPVPKPNISKLYNTYVSTSHKGLMISLQYCDLISF